MHVLEEILQGLPKGSILFMELKKDRFGLRVYPWIVVLTGKFVPIFSIDEELRKRTKRIIKANKLEMLTDRTVTVRTLSALNEDRNYELVAYVLHSGLERIEVITGEP